VRATLPRPAFFLSQNTLPDAFPLEIPYISTLRRRLLQSEWSGHAGSCSWLVLRCTSGTELEVESVKPPSYVVGISIDAREFDVLASTLITESSGAETMRVVRSPLDVVALTLKLPALPEDVSNLMVESMTLHKTISRVLREMGHWALTSCSYAN
jgi:hypothetical protein